jgi:hypothetical protein
MILIKSLIVVFIMLLLAKYGKPIIIFLSNLLDGREGFDDGQNKDEVKDEVKEEDNKDIVELSYSLPTTLEIHNEMANDSQLISELQDKMSELTQLSEKASEINNQLNK